MQMLKAAYEEAKRILKENREALDKIAAFLIEKETITGKEFMQILHEVKGITEDAEPSRKEERIAMKSKKRRKTWIYLKRSLWNNRRYSTAYGKTVRCASFPFPIQGGKKCL